MEKVEDDILYSLTGHGCINTLSDCLAQTLGVKSEQITILEENDERVLFIISDCFSSVQEVLNKLNDNDRAWICSVAETEEEILLDEEEAYKMWQEMSEDSRTAHLQEILTPDGELIQPQHTLPPSSSDKELSEQLKRDPKLFEEDNVPRVKLSQIHQANWEEPFVIELTSDSGSFKHILSRDNLVEHLGEVKLRTGNRNTLIESGFDNSLPRTLTEARDNHHCIIFTPTAELPLSFQKMMDPIFSAFPPFRQSRDQKHTLCLAHEAGFGIGMHKHNEAFFWLLHGRKKWYMAPSSSPLMTSPTHPGFYSSKSSHKCIQSQDEVLYVPDQWYHEIFNLEHSVGVQALPG